MDQDFDNWNIKKKELSNGKRVYFHKGEVWFTSIGKNLGDEEDGKNSGSTAILSQIRLFDAKRLLRPMGRINNDELNEIKIKLGKIV